MSQGHVAHFQWLVTHTEASFCLSCCSLYIYMLPYLSFSLSTTNLQPGRYHPIYQTSIPFTWCNNPLHLCCLLRIVQSVSILYLMLNSFIIYLNFVYPTSIQTRQSLRVYPSHVGDRCLMCQVNNHVFARERAMIRCICQVRMTSAPFLLMKGYHPPTHLPQGRMMIWMQTNQKVT